MRDQRKRVAAVVDITERYTKTVKLAAIRRSLGDLCLNCLLSVLPLLEGLRVICASDRQPG